MLMGPISVDASQLVGLQDGCACRALDLRLVCAARGGRRQRASKPNQLARRLFPAAILQKRVIHPTEITNQSITLTGVAKEFVRMVEQGRDIEEVIRVPSRK